MFTLNCRGKLLVIDSPVIMGIINITPDSFYSSNSNDDILPLAGKMIQEGAAILDIGGQSTRPGSQRITAAEEIKRVLPVIEKLKAHFPDTIISIDTYSSKVAEVAAKAGAAIINDISGGEMDTQMLGTVAALDVPYVCMHMKGTPETMQQLPHYENVITEILDFFNSKLQQCKKAGIKDVIIDPGFGFGKTMEHNFSLLKNLHAFSILDKPVLAGISRKSMVYKTLNTTAENALNGTSVLNTMALLNGASILRVHDVKEARQAITLYEQYKKAR
jgi:dihydropteroate synthase